MKKLLNGIIEFRQQSLEDYRKKFSSLALNQSPDTLFVACCDSRVVPNVFASSNPGDLFVLRNIGNLIPPYHKAISPNSTDESVAAAIEFALECLHVSHIVICGHSDCGAMNATLKHTTDNPAQFPFLNIWLKNVEPSYARFQKSKPTHADISPCNQLSQINVLQQIDHLKTYPVVIDRINNKQLTLHGWWFDLATANIFYFDEQVKVFLIIDDAKAQQLLTQIQ